jgi:hypothetical protein
VDLTILSLMGRTYRFYLTFTGLIMNWIIDRKPTEEDADDSRNVLRWVGNSPALVPYYNIQLGQPWMRCPKAPVEPARWIVESMTTGIFLIRDTQTDTTLEIKCNTPSVIGIVVESLNKELP